MRAGVVVLVGLAVLVSGCAKGETATTASLPSASVSFTETTGGIEGLVTDSEINPLVGAIVGLVEKPDVVTQTDAAGKFALSNIDPGTYTVAVTQLGFKSTAKRVDVVIGQVSQVSVALDVLPVAVPYTSLIIHKGIIKNGLGVMQTATCQNCGTNETRTEFDDGFPVDWQGLTIEVEWNTNDFLGIDLLDRDDSDGYGGVYWRVREASPIRGFVERCADYQDTYFASDPMPCEEEEFVDHQILVEDWYVGGFADTTQQLNVACPLYTAGCYGIGWQPELVFTNYLSFFHMELPPDVELYTVLEDS